MIHLIFSSVFSVIVYIDAIKENTDTTAIEFQWLDNPANVITCLSEQPIIQTFEHCLMAPII